MANKGIEMGFAQWATIEVQGRASIEKIVERAQASRNQIDGTLDPDEAKIDSEAHKATVADRIIAEKQSECLILKKAKE